MTIKNATAAPPKDLQPLEDTIRARTNAKSDWNGIIAPADAKKILADLVGKDYTADDVTTAIADLDKQQIISPEAAQLLSEVAGSGHLAGEGDAVAFTPDQLKASPVAAEYLALRDVLNGDRSVASTQVQSTDVEVAVRKIDGAAAMLAKAKTPAEVKTAETALKATMEKAQSLAAVPLTQKLDAETFGQKFLDVLVEIITFGQHDTQLFNGKVNVEAWQTAGRDMMSSSVGPALQARFAVLLKESEGDVNAAKGQLNQEIDYQLAMANVTSSTDTPDGGRQFTFVTSAEEIKNAAAALTDGIVDVAIGGETREVKTPTDKLSPASLATFQNYHDARAKIVNDLESLNQSTNQARQKLDMLAALDQTVKGTVDALGKDAQADAANFGTLGEAIVSVQQGHVPTAPPPPSQSDVPAKPPTPDWPTQNPTQTARMHRLLGKDAGQDDVARVEALLIQLGAGKPLGKYGPNKDGVDGVAGGGFETALKQALTHNKIKVAPDKVLDALNALVTAKDKTAAGPT